MVTLLASTLAGKEKEKKRVEEPPKKTDSKTEKRGAEELPYEPQLSGGYAGGYAYGDTGYELGSQQSLGLLGYGAQNLSPTSRIKSIVITKEVTIPVPHPYPVPVEKTIPFPIKVPVPVPVVRHVPVPVPKPYPVPVEKNVPYPVEKIVPFPVKVPVRVAVPVPHPVPVSKPYPVPVHVPVLQPAIVKNPAVVLQVHGGVIGGYGSAAGDYSYDGVGLREIYDIAGVEYANDGYH